MVDGRRVVEAYVNVGEIRVSVCAAVLSPVVVAHAGRIC